MSDPCQVLTDTDRYERDRLPESLRDIPPTDLEAVVSLPGIYLKPLAEACAMNRIDIPRAVEFIKDSGEIFITPQEICAAAGRQDLVSRRSNMKESCSTSEAAQTLPQTAQPFQEDIDTLAHLLQNCFRDMPDMTAESMASAGMMREALAVVTATRLAFESKYARTEFVLLTLFYLFDQSRKKTLERINQSPALRMFLDDKGYLPG